MAFKKVWDVFEIFRACVCVCVRHAFFKVLWIELVLGFWCDQPEIYSYQSKEIRQICF